MENSRFLECLEADYRRMREVVPGHLDARVPTCPDWTVADLTRHVGQVYLHKVECMRDGASARRTGRLPGSSDEEPVALLDRAYGELVAEFTTRDPADIGRDLVCARSDGRVLVRRMAQESVIHRIDAELGAGAPVAPVPDDLAVDGSTSSSRSSSPTPSASGPSTSPRPCRTLPGVRFLIQADATADSPSVSWLVRTAPGPLHGRRAAPREKLADAAEPDVTISGAPTDVLRWAWNRETPGEPSPVTDRGRSPRP